MEIATNRKIKFDLSQWTKLSNFCQNWFFLQVDFTAKPTYWRSLYPPVKMKLGELLVSLTYLPAKNTLTIGILKARNLKAKDINGKSGKFLPTFFHCEKPILHIDSAVNKPFNMNPFESVPSKVYHFWLPFFYTWFRVGI